jgi:hypothetical protein
MNIEDLISHAEAIIDEEDLDRDALLIESLEFFRRYAGENSSFYIQLHEKTKDIKIRLSEFDFSNIEPDVVGYIKSSLKAFVRFAKKGLIDGISIKRQAEIDVVSDILSQANVLLEDKRVHPAAACVVAGAALEEYLRNWMEENGEKLGTNDEKSIGGYAAILKRKNLIDRQDIKDITSWAGLRNSAAHGDWVSVESREKIEIMVKGINLFLRKHLK